MEKVHAEQKPGLMVLGFVMGLLGAILGIGGGTVAVPTLNDIFHLPIKNSIANSLATIVVASSLGAVVYFYLGAGTLFSAQQALLTAVVIVPGSVIGAQAGTHFSKYIPTKHIKYIFYALLLYIAYNHDQKRDGLVMIVLKVGGSLFEEAPALLRHIATMSADVLIVPGGGEFADVVRRIDRERGLTADAAHWMAVLAMDEYAYYLSDKTGIELSCSLSAKKGVHIALPYEMLKANDELPHSWDVTSDTIAAWVALKINCPLIKATNVDGIIINGDLMQTRERFPDP